MTPSETPILKIVIAAMKYAHAKGLHHDGIGGDAGVKTWLEEHLQSNQNETPIQPDYTPMSVTGDKVDMIILEHCLTLGYNSLKETYMNEKHVNENDLKGSEKVLGIVAMWKAAVAQSIKDSQFESSRNPLPFPEK